MAEENKKSTFRAFASRAKNGLPARRKEFQKYSEILFVANENMINQTFSHIKYHNFTKLLIFTFYPVAILPEKTRPKA